MRRSRIATMAAAALVTAGVGGFLTLSPNAQAATVSRIPAHVFAPYYEEWTGPDINTVSQASGNLFMTLAFLQTANVGSCTALWGGTGAVSSSNHGSEISALRARGGDVIPSYGGFTADTNGTELADSCTSVDSIAADFEKVITTYDVTRIDLDVEVDSLTRTAGIDRRNKAIKKVEDWAAANGRVVQFQYTLPTSANGLNADALAVLQNAKQNNARIDYVNLMTFDYYDAVQHDMAATTISAATGLFNQLKALWPGKTDAQYWNQVGIIEMPGHDDWDMEQHNSFELFTLANATTVTNWAKSKGIGELSFWDVQRDNGNCPNTIPTDDQSCTGVAQSAYQFSKIMQSFSGGPATTAPTTRPATTPPTTSPTTRPTTAPPTTRPTTAPPTTRPTTAPPTTAPAGTAWAPYTAYSVGAVVTYQGKRYSCRQSHTSLPGWEPATTLALWLPL
jgi:chitinase